TSSENRCRRLHAIVVVVVVSCRWFHMTEEHKGAGRQLDQCASEQQVAPHRTIESWPVRSTAFPTKVLPTYRETACLDLGPWACWSRLVAEWSPLDVGCKATYADSPVGDRSHRGGRLLPDLRT